MHNSFLVAQTLLKRNRVVPFNPEDSNHYNVRNQVIIK